MANEIGNMVDSSTMDTASANATAIYPLQAHYGSNQTYNSIYSGGAPMSGLDPTSDPTDVTGSPIPPNPTPIPQPLSRNAPITGIVNSEARGVYFEGTLVPVIGDGIPAPLAAPDPRPLTTPGKYGSIFIGTRT